MSFLKWSSSSLQGNVVGFEVGVSLPVFLVLLHQNSAQWTVGWTIYAAFASLAMGALCGAIFWFVVTRPLLKGRQAPPPNNRWRGP
jgi:hypothetical protein